MLDLEKALEQLAREQGEQQGSGQEVAMGEVQAQARVGSELHGLCVYHTSKVSVEAGYLR